MPDTFGARLNPRELLAERLSDLLRIRRWDSRRKFLLLTTGQSGETAVGLVEPNVLLCRRQPADPPNEVGAIAGEPRLHGEVVDIRRNGDLATLCHVRFSSV